MKRCLLAAASSLALIGSAMAIQPAMAQGASPMPVWTGSYVGLNIGAISARTNIVVFDDAFLWHDTKGPRKTAVTLGGQVGHNWQWDNFVFGLEADLNWANARKSRTEESTFPGVFSDLSSRLSWYGTVRPRAGFLLAPPTLLYATGGLAVAGIKNRVVNGAGPFDIRESGTRIGWTAGAGVEHQFANNYSVKAEVLYMDFGRKTASHSFGGVDTFGRFRNTAVVGRVGVNVRW